ncbi:hypothetical protein F1B92_01175 [Campylobacter sp. FMV-PI01]|uniref:Uncharacterized protein n=1 Tax=Campylobacter portucalensis TaxID=2608384 RepID=A0A6L5WHV2_9BACT|nr:hypothetical protein [Campylobacter portucalensis]MSN95817.1 hypothetical protein [Campylobacter portucalensis]
MALPFIAGLAVGSLAVVAFKNRDKIEDFFYQSIEKGKDIAQNLKDNCCTNTCDENINSSTKNIDKG